MTNITSDITVLLLLISRVPLYGYAFYKAYQLRSAQMIVLSSWFMVLAFFALIGALTYIIIDSPALRLLVSYLVPLSMFMLALTAKAAKVK
jgi:hypothetical protein